MKRIFVVGIAGWLALGIGSAPSFAEEGEAAGDPAEQVQARPRDRLRILNIPSEKKPH